MMINWISKDGHVRSVVETLSDGSAACNVQALISDGEALHWVSFACANATHAGLLARYMDDCAWMDIGEAQS